MSHSEPFPPLGVNSLYVVARGANRAVARLLTKGNELISSIFLKIGESELGLAILVWTEITLGALGQLGSEPQMPGGSCRKVQHSCQCCAAHWKRLFFKSSSNGGISRMLCHLTCYASPSSFHLSLSLVSAPATLITTPA